MSDGAGGTVGRPPYLDQWQLAKTLPLSGAIDALEQGLAALGEQPLQVTPRTALSMPRDGARAQGEMLLMPAFGPQGAGAKLVTICPENPDRGLPRIQGLYVLFSQASLSPELLIDGSALTNLRTAAVSALATRHLAREDSRRLVVFGAGVQASAHVEAMRAVLPIETVTIVASSPASARGHELVARLRGADIEASAGTPDSVAGADVVCTCTTSASPVFNGAAVVRGTHINAIGAYRPDLRELDGSLLARSTIFVETREAALAEAGDILQAIAAGQLPDDDFAYELTDVIAGRARRSSDDQITVFKSVGVAVEDLIIARAVADRLRTAEPV
jgi:ornithine cyclodeaminase/alanine dehydrogenase-like protein (mu-crystallin family)